MLTAPDAQSVLATSPKQIQAYGSLMAVPLGLNENARAASVASLNQLLADTITLRDLYKKAII